MRSAGRDHPKQLAKAASAPEQLGPQQPGKGSPGRANKGIPTRIAKHAHDAAQAASGRILRVSDTMHDTLGRPLFGATQGQSSFAYLELHLPDNERQEALEACKLARQELLRFVAAPPPRQSFRSCFTLLVVVLLRPFLAPFLGGCLEGWLPIPEFMQALLALGGIERASVMLAICRFDADQNGNLTDHEYRVFQEGGKELLRNTVSLGQHVTDAECQRVRPLPPTLPTLPAPFAHR